MKNIKRIFSTITLCLCFSAFAFSAFAINLADAVVDFDGDDRKGQYLYRKYCRLACHAGNTAAPAISPTTYTMGEWEKFVDNMDKLPCFPNWPQDITPEILNDIFTYLHGGAKDSPNPVSCS